MITRRILGSLLLSCIVIGWIVHLIDGLILRIGGYIYKWLVPAKPSPRTRKQLSK